MIKNNYGQPIYNEQDLFDLYMTNPTVKLKHAVIVDEVVPFDPALELENVPNLVKELTENINMSVEDFDQILRSQWFMPDEYKTFDIAKFVLDQCTHEEELLMYEKRGLFTLLQYMKYLVDLMRKNNIVWGVGRGSSVSSFVLFLIGIHRINSLHYDLNIEEFLK